MPYLNKNFWRMAGLFGFIIVLTLTAIYQLKQYDLKQQVDNGAASVNITQ